MLWSDQRRATRLAAAVRIRSKGCSDRCLWTGVQTAAPADATSTVPWNSTIRMALVSGAEVWAGQFNDQISIPKKVPTRNNPGRLATGNPAIT